MKVQPALRKKAEADVIAIMSEVDKSGKNAELLKNSFKTMSDATFVALLENGVPVYAPVGGPTKIDYKRNIKIASKLGLNLEQRLWITNPKTGLTQRTRYPHVILKLPYRRQTQMIDKKLSVAKHDKIRDKLTGQVTGPSKASGVSFPEAYVMFSSGYDVSLEEFLHGRGGNDKLQRAFYQSLRNTGKGRIRLPGVENTAAKSTRTQSAIFKAIHIGNNIGSSNVHTKNSG